MGMCPKRSKLNDWEGPRIDSRVRKEWRAESEEVTLLGPDEYQSSKHPGDLGNLPRDSNNKDRL